MVSRKRSASTLQLTFLVYGMACQLPLPHSAAHSPLRDTVDSVGFFPKRLPFTTSNTIVRTFRHAISLDERRAKFRANFWNRPNQKELKLGTQANPGPQQSMQPCDSAECAINEKASLTTSLASPQTSFVQNCNGSSHAKSHNHRNKKNLPHSSELDKKLNLMEQEYPTHKEYTTDVEEVWFAVC